MEINKRNARMWSMLGTRGTFGFALEQLAAEKDFVAMSADLCRSSGLEKFAANYPERFINTGIAEQNLIGIASGIAANGHPVFVTSFAPFATGRCLDQIRMNMAYMQQNIKIVGLSAGFEPGLSGNSHYGLEDAALMRCLPDIAVVTPCDGAEIVKVLEAACEYDKPMYIRLTGARFTQVVYTDDFAFEIGKGIKLCDGNDVLLVGNGMVVAQMQKAAKKLAENGISAAVVDMHTLKPLDAELILQEAAGKKLIVTVEEHSIVGGLGTAVAELMAEQAVGAKLVRIGTPDHYGKAGTMEYMMQHYGLDAEGIAARVTEALNG